MLGRSEREGGAEEGREESRGQTKGPSTFEAVSNPSQGGWGWARLGGGSLEF